MRVLPAKTSCLPPRGDRPKRTRTQQRVRASHGSPRAMRMCFCCSNGNVSDDDDGSASDDDDGEDAVAINDDLHQGSIVPTHEELSRWSSYGLRTAIVELRTKCASSYKVRTYAARSPARRTPQFSAWARRLRKASSRSSSVRLNRMATRLCSSCRAAGA